MKSSQINEMKRIFMEYTSSLGVSRIPIQVSKKKKAWNKEKELSRRISTRLGYNCQILASAIRSCLGSQPLCWDKLLQFVQCNSSIVLQANKNELFCIYDVKWTDSITFNLVELVNYIKQRQTNQIVSVFTAVQIINYPKYETIVLVLNKEIVIYDIKHKIILSSFTFIIQQSTKCKLSKNKQRIYTNHSHSTDYQLADLNQIFTHDKQQSLSLAISSRPHFDPSNHIHNDNGIHNNSNISIKHKMMSQFTLKKSYHKRKPFASHMIMPRNKIISSRSITKQHNKEQLFNIDQTQLHPNKQTKPPFRQHKDFFQKPKKIIAQDKNITNKRQQPSYSNNTRSQSLYSKSNLNKRIPRSNIKKVWQVFQNSTINGSLLLANAWVKKDPFIEISAIQGYNTTTAKKCITEQSQTNNFSKRFQNLVQKMKACVNQSNKKNNLKNQPQQSSEKDNSKHISSSKESLEVASVSFLNNLMVVSLYNRQLRLYLLKKGINKITNQLVFNTYYVDLVLFVHIYRCKITLKHKILFCLAQTFSAYVKVCYLDESFQISYENILCRLNYIPVMQQISPIGVSGFSENGDLTIIQLNSSTKQNQTEIELFSKVFHNPYSNKRINIRKCISHSNGCYLYIYCSQGWIYQIDRYKAKIINSKQLASGPIIGAAFISNQSQIIIIDRNGHFKIVSTNTLQILNQKHTYTPINPEFQMVSITNDAFLLYYKHALKFFSVFINPRKQFAKQNQLKIYNNLNKIGSKIQNHNNNNKLFKISHGIIYNQQYFIKISQQGQFSVFDSNWYFKGAYYTQQVVQFLEAKCDYSLSKMILLFQDKYQLISIYSNSILISKKRLINQEIIIRFNSGLQQIFCVLQSNNLTLYNFEGFVLKSVQIQFNPSFIIQCYLRQGQLIQLHQNKVIYRDKQEFKPSFTFPMRSQIQRCKLYDKCLLVLTTNMELQLINQRQYSWTYRPINIDSNWQLIDFSLNQILWLKTKNCHSHHYLILHRLVDGIFKEQIQLGHYPDSKLITLFGHNCILIISKNNQLLCLNTTSNTPKITKL